MILALALLLATLVLRAASSSRRVHGKLLTSCLLFATSAAAAALVRYAPLTPPVVDQIRTVNPLLITFGVINVLVVLAINPWRENRVPEQFPTIVQDAIVIGVFALAAMLFMQEKILATTAVGAVVIGFALQDTLGNLFAGLAIQIEKPFRVGHWVTIAGTDGVVTRSDVAGDEDPDQGRQLRDRARTASSPRRRSRTTRSRRRTRGSRSRSAPATTTPPNEVKAVDSRRVVRRAADRARPAARGADRRLRRVGDHLPRARLDDRLRRRHAACAIASARCIYYAFRRHGISIPYPIQVQIGRTLPPARRRRRRRDAGTFDVVEIFAPLSDEQRGQPAATARAAAVRGGRGRSSREGAAGNSMFVVMRGEAVGDAREDRAARWRGCATAAFFGEMSLLTGEPRTRDGHRRRPIASCWRSASRRSAASCWPTRRLSSGSPRPSGRAAPSSDQPPRARGRRRPSAETAAHLRRPRAGIFCGSRDGSPPSR